VVHVYGRLYGRLLLLAIGRLLLAVRCCWRKQRELGRPPGEPPPLRHTRGHTKVNVGWGPERGWGALYMALWQAMRVGFYRFYKYAPGGPWGMS
jgi:hypothetical protein